jgi:type II secretory pathway pseudopilin PulG
MNGKKLNKSNKKNKYTKNKGFVFISALVIVVIMSILITMITKSWTYQIKRSNEEELIYIGEHYARAIRNFHLQHKRYPFKLKELIETKPRYLRKLYKDPITKDDLEIIRLSDVLSGKLQKGKTNNRQSTPPPVSFSSQKLTSGQIVGVYSKSKEKPFKNYQKGDFYSDWKFLGMVTNNHNNNSLQMKTNK